MSGVPVQEFENRATEAEKQIEVLTKRLDFLEKALANQGGSANQQLLEQVQKGSGQGGDVNAADLIKQNKELKEEREALKVENGKLKYRIKHILRTLEAEENKNKTKQ